MTNDIEPNMEQIISDHIIVEQAKKIDWNKILQQIEKSECNSNSELCEIIQTTKRIHDFKITLEKK